MFSADGTPLTFIPNAKVRWGEDRACHDFMAMVTQQYLGEIANTKICLADIHIYTYTRPPQVRFVFDLQREND